MAAFKETDDQAPCLSVIPVLVVPSFQLMSKWIGGITICWRGSSRAAYVTKGVAGRQPATGLIREARSTVYRKVASPPCAGRVNAFATGARAVVVHFSVVVTAPVCCWVCRPDSEAVIAL